MSNTVVSTSEENLFFVGAPDPCKNAAVIETMPGFGTEKSFQKAVPFRDFCAFTFLAGESNRCYNEAKEYSYWWVAINICFLLLHRKVICDGRK